MAKDTDIRKAFVDQAAHCKDLGSPFMARLCTLFSERLVLTDPVGQVLSNWSGDVSVSGDVLPLRLAGALHALVLEHRCEALATVYPPHHNDLDDDTLWQAVNGALITDADFIVDWLDSPPQTNEVRRSGVLLPGFLAIADLVEKPLVLSEIGASAGLNLFWDRFHYGLGDVTWGEENSALHLEPQWEGEAVAPQAMARDLGPQGVHVAYVTIDGVIDVTWLGSEEERPSWMKPPEGWKWEREDYFVHPDGIAEEVYHMAHQEKSVWSFETVIRPFAEKW